MSKLGMNKALWAMYTSAERTEQALSDPAAFLADFDLTPHESSAVAALDFAALLTAGAHPFLMFKAALRTRGPMNLPKLREYVGQLHGLELRDIVT